MKKLGENGFTLVAGVLILLTAGVLGFAGYYVYNEQQKKSDNSSTQATSQSTQDAKKQTENKSQEETDKLPEGWAEYIEPTTGFILPYPVEWGEPTIVKSEMPHNGSSYNISFKNEEIKGMINSADYEYTGGGRGAPVWWIGVGSYEVQSALLIEAVDQASAGNPSYKTELLSKSNTSVITTVFDCYNQGVPLKLLSKINHTTFKVLSLADISNTDRIGCEEPMTNEKPSKYVKSKTVEQFKTLAELLSR